MRRARLVVVTFIVALTTVGVPTHASASGWVPPALDGERSILSSVDPAAHASVAVPLAWRANLIGVSFVSKDDAAEGVSIVARARTAKGWENYDLEVAPEERPDAAESGRALDRVFTEPVWVGTTRALRLDLELTATAAAISDVRLHLYNTNGDAFEPTAVSRVAGAWRAVVRFLSSTAITPAEASPTRPTFVSRKAWGADESLVDDPPGNASSVKVVFVHHTVNSNGYSKSEAKSLVRGIFNYHVKGRGYSDIAYNFLVDRYGQTFEGRGGGVDQPVIGGHTLGFNTGSIGVAMLGTFSNVTPPSATRTALRNLLAWKMDVHHIPPTGKVTMVSGSTSSKYDKGTKVSFNRIAAHRNANDTACPGWDGYTILPALRTAVEARGNPKIYLPTATTTTLRPDGDAKNETVTVAATLSRSSAWTVSFIDSSGVARRTVKGTGKTVSVAWNGKLTTGDFARSGRYTWTLTAKDSAGHVATPVNGVVYLSTLHPPGTLLSDTTGAYTNWRVTSSLTALTRAAKFGTLPAVATGPAERSFAPAGAPLTLRPATLLSGPDGAHYIWSGGTLRRFANDPTATPAIDAFASLGYNTSAVIPADQAVIDSLPAGAPVEDVTVHPDGTVVKNLETGFKWVVSTGTLRPISTLARRSRYRSSEVVTAAAGDLALPIGTPYTIRPGTLVKATDGGAPWVIRSGTKQRFINWTLFGRMGFTTAMLVTSSQADLDAVTEGPIYG